MEDDPSFDAGTGSFLNADGRAQLDASIMNGSDLKTGAVAAVECIRNPISLARKVLESDWAFIVGEGARRFAKQVGIEECDPWDLATPGEIVRWSRNAGKVLYYLRDEQFYRNLLGSKGDTVGCVAMDAKGNVAAGTSTGGSPNKPVGRVGDSPIIGAGTYADNAKGGASMTGPGELVIRVLLAKHAVDLLGQGLDPMRVAQESMEYLRTRVGGIGGIILVDREGRIGHAKTTSIMARAYMSQDMAAPVVEI
jgi:beta-aspartyl-peptidase (threonine type)